VGGEELPGRAVRRLIAIERDGARQSALTLERPLKECFRRSDIPPRAQQKIDRLSSAVDSTIEISPAAFDLHVSFVDPPRAASFAGEPVPTFFEFGNVALDPTHDGRVRQFNSAFGHHLHEISKTELEPTIPTHAKDDDLPVKWRPLKSSSMLGMRAPLL
jgi:hypothetical protein